MLQQPEHTPLLDHNELERLQGMILDRRDRCRTVSSPYSGPAISRHRGYGMELHDVRPYHHGDDIRHMDWRATARSHKPTTRIYLEERQHSLLLVVDRRPGMRFGTRGEIKAARAARIASIMAFTALAAQEHVAGLVIEDGLMRFAPARSLTGVFPLIRALAAPLHHTAPSPSTADEFHQVCTHIAQHGERGTSVCLIGDFHDVDERHSPALRYLAEQFEPIAIRVVDPAERTLQATGRMRIVSPVTGRITVIDSDDAGIRQRYNDLMGQHSNKLHAIFTSAGFQYLTVDTDKDTFRQLGALS